MPVFSNEVKDKVLNFENVNKVKTKFKLPESCTDEKINGLNNN